MELTKIGPEQERLLEDSRHCDGWMVYLDLAEGGGD